MGSFVFKWEHPASEVFVTGTFDDWSKSEQLVKTGEVFEKNVTLSKADEKIYYKFVVDGNWVTDHTAPRELDPSGNENNVLTTDRIVKHTPATAGIMSGVAPTSTTAELAKDVPLEKAPLENSGSSDLPGAFPETPAAIEKGDFSVNPIPEPGHTLTSGVRDDPELVALDKAKQAESEQTVGVAPLPAFPGAVNPPVNVAPGEKLPDPNTVTGNSIHNNVTLDKESYEKSGGVGNAPVLPPVVTPQAERDTNGTGVLDIPPISKNLILESSLPIGAAGVGTFDASPTIQSAGPQTTSQLAANVPLESTKVPEIVKESQEEAGVAPEASAVPEEVKEKTAVEKELLHEVPVASSTSEGTAGKGTDKSEKTVTAGEAAAAIGGAAVAVGGAAAAYVSGAAEKLPESVTSKLPESVQNSIKPTTTKDTSNKTSAKDTPEIVKESITESGESPEATTNQEAVLEKKAVEKELLEEVKPETSTRESAPKSVEPAKLATPSLESRDVSPGTVPGSHTQPTVTTGVASTTTDKVTGPATPQKDSSSKNGTPSSSKVTDSAASSPSTDKKKKRTSIFGKIKAKFSDKEKK